MNPVKVFQLKNNETQNTQSTSSSPLLKKKPQHLPERHLVINMSPVLNGHSPIKAKFNVTRLQTNTKNDDKLKIAYSYQNTRLSFNKPTIIQSTSQSPKKRLLNGSISQESLSPMKLPNLRNNEFQFQQKTDPLIRIESGKIQKRTYRKDSHNETIQTPQQQNNSSIIKLIQSEATPNNNNRLNLSKVKMGSQTIEQETKQKIPDQILLMHGRSTSQGVIINTLVDENQVQDYIQLFYSKTQAGQNGNGQTKTNQDSVIVTNNLGGIKNRYIFSVCDGHGVYGHYVSQLIKKTLPIIIEQSIKSVIGKTEKEISKENEQEIQKIFKQSFKKMSTDLSTCGIDITFSGSTCSLVFISGSHLWCANIGDSRSLLIEEQYKNKWKIIELSHDHKPDLPSEKQRIIASKGRVEPFITEDGEMIGPARVWLSDDQIPGLAMSRSFGDYVASTVGVISEPEIIHYQFQRKNAFLVVASDGVWEFISNEEISKILQQNWSENMTAKKIDEICTQIIYQSTQRWKQEDEVIDDISIVVAYLQKPE